MDCRTVKGLRPETQKENYDLPQVITRQLLTATAIVVGVADFGDHRR
jgi:hypothetical protein